MVHSEDVVLRPTTDADLGELRVLFDDPSFAEWGGRGRMPDAEIKRKYLGLRLPEVECFLVLDGADPVGLAQLHADDAHGGGLDLILLSRARGRGLGSAAVRALVTRARDVHGWTRVTVDPDLSNADGIRFWKAAGFEPTRRVLAERGREPYLLMELVAG